MEIIEAKRAEDRVNFREHENQSEGHDPAKLKYLNNEKLSSYMKAQRKFVTSLHRYT